MGNIEDQPFKITESLPILSNQFSWLNLAGMTLVFLIILLISLIIIRKLRQASLGISKSRWIRVLDRQSLGGQQMIYLVELAGKLQVLGASEHSLFKISEIDDPQIAAEILADLTMTSAKRGEGVLPRLLGKVAHKKQRRDFNAELEKLLQEAKNDELRL